MSSIIRGVYQTGLNWLRGITIEFSDTTTLFINCLCFLGDFDRAKWRFYAY